MRFGRTTEQALQDWRENQHRLNMGIDRFAWIPVRLHDGRWLWWEEYVAATQVSGGGYKWIRYLPGSPELEVHRGWAKRHAEGHFW